MRNKNLKWMTRLAWFQANNVGEAFISSEIYLHILFNENFESSSLGSDPIMSNLDPHAVKKLTYETYV